MHSGLGGGYVADNYRILSEYMNRFCDING